jgi:hypothetical protein
MAAENSLTPSRKPFGDVVVIQARIHQRCVEVQDPIPAEWEGQLVKIVPMTPDDPMPDLEERLAILRAMGPMEFEPGEREMIASAQGELDRLRMAAL